jgi:MYXO-CTERM domain-containing protein
MGPVQVELQDALGTPLTTQAAEVTVALGANPEGGALLGTTTATTVNGVATFSDLSIRKAGNGYSLVASAPGFTGATSPAFEVSPAAINSYTVAMPSSIGAGQEVTLSATAYDAFGNISTGYNGAARATSSDTAAVLPANKAFAAGVLTGLKVTFKTPGLATLTLTDVERNTIAGSAQINVTAYAQPTATVTDPAEGSTVSGKVTISARGAVAPGATLRSLAILVDGVVIASGTEATLTGTWDSSVAVNGPHTVSAVISDSVGNVTTSAPVGVVVKGGRSGCGCGATSGADASVVLAALALLRYAGLRRRRAQRP